MTKLVEGDVFEIKHGDKVYTDVPNHFIYSNRKGDWAVSRSDVLVKHGGLFDFLIGKYIVTRTTFDGGGTAMFNDEYPNGHHVFAVKVDNDRINIDFYQSGAFTAMIKNREPVGKAKITYTYEEDRK